MGERPIGDRTDSAAGAAPVIDSRAGFIAALRWGFSTAIAGRTRRIVCVDADFAEWPLDDPALLSGLTAWLRLPQRRLVLLARGYDELPRRHPRFNAWRANWSHAIDGWVAPPELAAELPVLLLADEPLGVHLIDAIHWRGRASVEPRDVASWLQEIDAVLQRSERGLAVNTLGL